MKDSILNFQVKKSAITAEGGVLVKGKCALIREDTNQAIAVVGENFGLVQNDKLYQAIDEKVFGIVGDTAKENAIINDRVSFGGKNCFREYVFPTIKLDSGIVRRSDDGVTDLGFVLTVANGFGSSALKVLAGALDYYCSNGLFLGEMRASFSRRHSAHIDTLGMDTAVETAVISFNEQAEVWRSWAAKTLKDSEVVNFLEGVVPRGLGKKLFSQYETEKALRGPSVWALYSSLTNFASHTANGRFAVRNTGNDHEASTAMQRHIKVAKITRSKEFLSLVA